MDVNVNAAECITSATHWGYTVKHNICAGTQTVVEWGLMDFIAAVGITTFGFLILGMLLSFAIYIIRDTF